MIFHLPSLRRQPWIVIRRLSQQGENDPNFINSNIFFSFALSLNPADIVSTWCICSRRLPAGTSYVMSYTFSPLVRGAAEFSRAKMTRQTFARDTCDSSVSVNSDTVTVSDIWICAIPHLQCFIWECCVHILNLHAIYTLHPLVIIS